MDSLLRMESLSKTVAKKQAEAQGKKQAWKLGQKTLAVVPEGPVWKLAQDGLHYSSHRVTNRGPHRIALKISTSDQTNFRFRPTDALIDPGASVWLLIQNLRFYSLQTPDIVLSFIVAPSGPLSNVDSPKELWRTHSTAPPDGIFVLRQPTEPWSSQKTLVARAEALGKETLIVDPDSTHWTSSYPRGDVSFTHKYSYHTVYNVGSTKIAIKATSGDNTNYGFRFIQRLIRAGARTNLVISRRVPTGDSNNNPSASPIALHFLFVDDALEDEAVADQMWQEREDAHRPPDGIFVLAHRPPDPHLLPRIARHTVAFVRQPVQPVYDKQFLYPGRPCSAVFWQLQWQQLIDAPAAPDAETAFENLMLSRLPRRRSL